MATHTPPTIRLSRQVRWRIVRCALAGREEWRGGRIGRVTEGGIKGRGTSGNAAMSGDGADINRAPWSVGSDTELTNETFRMLLVRYVTVSS